VLSSSRHDFLRWSSLPTSSGVQCSKALRTNDALLSTEFLCVYVLVHISIFLVVFYFHFKWPGWLFVSLAVIGSLVSHRAVFILDSSFFVVAIAAKAKTEVVEEMDAEEVLQRLKVSFG